MPQIPDWYIIPAEIKRICEHAKLTTNTVSPMRNFLLRGPAGTGKTEGAKAIASGLPRVSLHPCWNMESEVDE